MGRRPQAIGAARDQRADGCRAAGFTAALIQRSIRGVAKLDARPDERAGLPEGHAKARAFVPVLTAPRLRRLRRRDEAAYRAARAEALLAAAARINGRRRS